MEFSRPEYWNGQPFPSPGNLPNAGIEPRSPVLQVDSLPAEPPGNPFYTLIKLYYIKSSERSSLITGPGLNSSPREAMDPGVIHGS